MTTIGFPYLYIHDEPLLVKRVKLRKSNFLNTIIYFLYKNSLAIISAGLYIGIYAANLDKLDM